MTNPKLRILRSQYQRQRQKRYSRASLDHRDYFRKLKLIQSLAITFSSLRDQDELFTAICQSAVELFGVDHSGLLLHGADAAEAEVAAEAPALGTRGLRIPLRGAALEERLLAERRPVACADIAHELAPGPNRAIFEQFGIRAVLLVPVIFQDRFLGSFSLDVIGRPHQFADDDIDLCAAFGAQVALALEYAQLLKQATHRAEQLEQVRHTTLAITSQRDRTALLDTIVAQAVGLLGAKSGGLYEYRPACRDLVIVADFRRPDQMIGQTMRLGKGMAGRLIADGGEFLCTADYDSSPFRDDQLQHRPFGAVLEVPLRWEGRAIGVLYVDDDRGREFGQADVQALQLLADHAAIALINAELAERDEAKHLQLERLARANSAIMGDLGTLALPERLALIAKQMSTILDAESGGIFLAQPGAIMTLEASYGHREGSFVPGRVYQLHSEPGQGLTGFIAAQGQLFNAHGDELRNHPARRGDEPHTPSGICSTLILPLKRHGGIGEELIGLLRVDNKRDRDGQASPQIGFSQEDEWILQLFANAAVVAIEDTRMVARLQEQSDYLDRLIASLPNGVIAVDSEGRITKYNHQAEQVLQYRADEVVGQLVASFYESPSEPRRIGAQLHASPDGRVESYETMIRSKNGDRIPIRLAATWLFDAQGQRIGSVGYFEDLRAARETQRRLDLLLKASTIVAQAEQFETGLTRLAEMLVSLLQCSFCRIFLLDDTKQHLVSTASYLAAGEHDQIAWTPDLNTRTALAEWPNLDRLLDEGEPRVFRARNPRFREMLAEWSRRLSLHDDIQALLVIPLRARDRVVGLLDLGEIRPWKLAPFSPEMIALAGTIADQTATLIDRMRLYAAAERQRKQLAALDEAARQLRAEKDPARLYQMIANLGLGLALGDAGGLFLNHVHIEEVELVVATGAAELDLGRRQHHGEGLIGYVARTGSPEIAYNYVYWHEQDPLLQAHRFQSLIAVPLRHAGEIEAVLFLAHTSQPYRFTPDTLEILERFAMHAALVLRTARLLTREQRAFGQLAVLHQMSDYIQTAHDMQGLLHIALTAITAGYGLGFNRAAIFLFDERADELTGQLGIGNISPSDADRDWDEHARSGREDFRRYHDLLEQQRITLTPVGERVRTLRLRLGPPNSDPFAQVVHWNNWQIVHPEEFGSLPVGFVGALQPSTDLAVVPLLGHGRAIGMLVADNKFTREPITHELIDSLLAFANTTAGAIETHMLIAETNRAHQQLQSFYKASNLLVWSQHEPFHVLSEIVERARQAAEARGVSLILFDANEQVSGVYATGSDTTIELNQIVRSNGISIQVLRTGEPEVIENAAEVRERVNPTMFDRNVAAGLCLPVMLKGQRMGVMWVHYGTPRHFPAAEIAATQLYVNQAAIAYDNARQIEALRKARDTARIVAQVTMLGQLQPTLESIVDGTRDVLGCDAVTLYPYQHERTAGLEAPITSGLRFPGRANRSDAQAKVAATFVLSMLQLEQMALIEDTARDPRFASRRFTLDEGVRSCVIIPLRVGRKRVGVMFINYHQPHQFTPDEVTSIDIFAYQAAVAIHNAQLYDQVQRRANTLQTLYEAGGAISGTLAQPDILEVVAEQAYALMSSYGQATVSMVGMLQNEQLVFTTLYPRTDLPEFRKRIGQAIDLRQGLVGQVGITGRAVITGTTQRVGNVQGDPHYLAYLPDTRSELAVPIRIRDRVIGVINLEHSQPDMFDAEHQRGLELLAAQAAIALENAQLFKDTRSLHNVILAASSTLQIDKVLRATAASIAREFAYESVGIHLLDEASGELSGPTYYAGNLPRKLNTRVDQGVQGRVIRTGASALVPDVSSDPDYVIGAKGTRAKLCVPLRIEQKVIGVINVESAQVNAFSSHDLHQLETIAQQVANRIENARLYTQLEQTKTALAARTAVAWMGMVSATWRHAIEGHAAAISAEINTIRAEAIMQRQLAGAISPKLDSRLSKISHLATEIMEHHIPAVPASDDETISLSIDSVLREQLRHFHESNAYQGVDLSFSSQLDDSITVRISHEWLRSLFDILLDNAVTAARAGKAKRVRVALTRDDGSVAIAVSDSGRGIPKAVRPALFRMPVEKQPGDRGMGMGLLLAQTIVQTYGGEISILSTTAKGTTMQVRLPIEKNQVIKNKNLQIALPTAPFIHNTNQTFLEDELQLMKVKYQELEKNLDMLVSARMSPLKELIQELQASEKKGREFLSNISHELRTPISHIRTVLESFLGGVYGKITEKQRQRLELALKQTLLEIRLIESLFELAQIQENNLSLHLESVDLIQITKDIIKRFETDATKNDITIQLDDTLEYINTHLDLHKIEQVIANLIDNSIKFTKRHGFIGISITWESAQIQFRIRDTGIGITEEHQSRIFDRFYQVDSSLTKKSGGAGIGLNIARNFIELHGGIICVEESALNAGTTILFTIPIISLE